MKKIDTNELDKVLKEEIKKLTKHYHNKIMNNFGEFKRLIYENNFKVNEKILQIPCGDSKKGRKLEIKKELEVMLKDCKIYLFKNVYSIIPNFMKDLKDLKNLSNNNMVHKWKDYIIKIVNKFPNDLNLKNEFILSPIDIFKSNDNFYFCIYKFIQYGTFEENENSKLIFGLNLKEKLEIFNNLYNAIIYNFSRNIIHYDIYRRNILLNKVSNNGKTKYIPLLFDYDVSKKYDSDEIKQKISKDERIYFFHKLLDLNKKYKRDNLPHHADIYNFLKIISEYLGYDGEKKFEGDTIGFLFSNLLKNVYDNFSEENFKLSFEKFIKDSEKFIKEKN